MDRDIPSFNRAVMERIFAKNHQLHLKRLKNIKSGISSNKSYQKSKPSYLPHSNSIVNTNYHIKLPQYNNLKKQVIQQSKNAQIQRQNALLFQKMIKIMKRPDKNNDSSSNRQRLSMNVAKQRLSMEYTKINEENRAFYHRLEHQKPTIDNKKLQEQRMKNLNILKFLGKYPNHQARARAAQYKTYDLRSRRMNSTSNRVFYNDQGMNNYQQDLDKNDEQNLIKFRNQMVKYDRHMQKLKMQQQNSGLNENKVNSTMGNFYNNKKKQKLSRQNGKYINAHNKQQSEMQIYEPVIPSRRKFISQGEYRNTGNQLQKDFVGLNQHDLNDDKQYQQELYPYHLNHPSHNIVIQDQNLYNLNKKNKKSIEMNIIPYQTDNNRTSFSKPSVSHQRKLNSKNVYDDLIPFREQQQKNNQIYRDQPGQFMRSDENTQIEPIPRFVKNKNKHKEDNKQQSSINKNVKKHDVEEYKNKQSENVILLYRSVVQLESMLLKQQKEQMMKDIEKELDRGSNNNDVEIESRLFDWMISRFNCQITIQRLFDCYKISVGVDSQDRMPLSKKRSYNKVEQSGSKQINIQNSTNRQLAQGIRRSIMLRLDHVCEVQIPQRQGSALLQQIDYDYKEFIKKMVKIQKDFNDNNVQYDQQQKQKHNQQQYRNSNNRQEQYPNYNGNQQQYYDYNDRYRLVIVLNENHPNNLIQTKNNENNLIPKNSIHNNQFLNNQDQDNQINNKYSLINRQKQQTPFNTTKSIEANSSTLIKNSSTIIKNSSTIIKNSSTIIKNSSTIIKNNIIQNQHNQLPIITIDNDNSHDKNDNKKQITNKQQSTNFTQIKQKNQQQRNIHASHNPIQSLKQHQQQQQQQQGQLLQHYQRHLHQQQEQQQQQHHQRQQEQQQHQRQYQQQQYQRYYQQQHQRQQVFNMPQYPPNQFYIQALDQQLL